MKMGMMALTIAGAAAGAMGQGYTVEALDTPTVQAAALAVNNQGAVVGWDLDLAGHLTGVRWNGSAAGVFAPPPGFAHAHASAIDAAGNTVAMLFSLGSFGGSAMAVDAGGAASVLGAFQARGNNDFGAVVGKRDIVVAGGWHSEEAVRWQDGVLTGLGAPGDVTSEATDINNAGVIVGSFIPAGQARPRACAWIGGTRFDLGTLGGPSAQAMAISDTGFVVGVSDVGAGLKHGYRLRLSPAGIVSERTDIGELGHGFSYACAVNAAGEVVGTSDSRAILWREGGLYDLNDLIPAGSGWTLLAASGISDDGRIVGWGRHDGAQARAFVLVPAAECYADCERDGDLDVFDYLCFLNEFVSASPYADCERDGDWDIFDYLCFQGSFAGGCP